MRQERDWQNVSVETVDGEKIEIRTYRKQAPGKRFEIEIAPNQFLRDYQLTLLFLFVLVRLLDRQ